jgi:hypothetical protein
VRNNSRIEIRLGEDELRQVTLYAATCARRVLPVFEATHPNDRPSLKRKLLVRARNARRHCARLHGRHTRPLVKSKGFPQPTLLTPPVTRLLLHTFTPSPARTKSNMFSGRRFIKLLPLNLKRETTRALAASNSVGPQASHPRQSEASCYACRPRVVSADASASF